MVSFEWLHTRQASIVLAALWGLGLACLFRKTCIGRNCIILKAPPIHDIHDQTYKFDGKCYKYKTESKTCTKEAIEH